MDTIGLWRGRALSGNGGYAVALVCHSELVDLVVDSQLVTFFE